MEQDYGVKCGVASDGNELTGRYKDYWVFVAVMACFYSFGVPILFMVLVYKFKYHATQGGDKVVMGALGWMFKPFRDGKEWWHVCALLWAGVVCPGLHRSTNSCALLHVHSPGWGWN